VSVLGALVLMKLLTEYLEPEEYGKLALGLTLSNLVTQTLMGSVTSSVTRFFSVAVKKNNLTDYLYATRNLTAASCLATIFVTFSVLCYLIFTKNQSWPHLILACLIFSIFSGLSMIASGIQSAARHQGIVTLHGGLESTFKLVLVVLLMLSFGAKSTVVAWGYVFSGVLLASSQLYFLKHYFWKELERQKPKYCGDWQREMLSFAWPFCLWGLVTWAHQSSDRWALSYLADNSVVGYYSVLYQLGYVPIGAAVNILVHLSTPILYQRSNTKSETVEKTDVDRLLRYMVYITLLFTTVIAAIACMFHDFLFSYLVSGKFREVSYLLPWMVIAGGFFSGGQILSLNLMSHFKTYALIPIKIITALIGIVTNIVGAYFYGLIGVICSLVTFSLIYFLWMIIVVRKSAMRHSENSNLMT
jgi:O-antigen/teichoic acid export membrane protein